MAKKKQTQRGQPAQFESRDQLARYLLQVLERKRDEAAKEFRGENPSVGTHWSLRLQEFGKNAERI